MLEFHPGLDPTYKTGLNSAYIIKACLTGLAMRKKGLDARHYLSPLSSEHALDNYYGDQQEHLDATAREKEKEKETEAKREEEKAEQRPEA